MDALVLAWTAFVKNTTIPRQILPDALREDVERTGNKVELLFMKARDRVRACHTFNELSREDQHRIATTPFDPYSRLS
jgi:hypothetical protein